MVDDAPNLISEAGANPFLDSALDVGLRRRVARESADAIYYLWNGAGKCYWRDTEHKNKAKPAEARRFFPTVTYRSTEALLDLILRHPDWLDEKKKDDIIDNHLPKVLSRSLAEVHSALDIPGRGGRNPFTTALYLSTACRANEIANIVKPAKIEAAGRQLLTICLNKNGRYISERHPFIQFHVLRAIIAFLRKAPKGPTEKRMRRLRRVVVGIIREETEKLLAKHMLNQLAPSDSVALVFCAATLAFDDDPDDRHYVLPALTVGFEAQDSSGCWPLGRVVRRFRGVEKNQARDFTISTYEIAWAATETLLRQRESIPRSKARWALERLQLAGRYAEISSVELLSGKPKRGWSSDCPYDESLVESWTSANVLQSIVSLGELIDDEICGEVLKTFVFQDPRNEDWTSWKRWASLKKNAEPEDEHQIFEYLEERIVNPIKDDPQKLPSHEKKTVSVLFFGPPGTSKTTLALALADALEWPIVMLSPGDFIKKGLEYIEAQATAVFDRLQKLRRVVVLFDECDELFRDRQPSDQSEQVRNITAFVTASMLPKLQDLHDRGRVVFSICTNKFDTLDPAIKRGGRIDHIIAVPPPQRNYRERIVKEQLQSIDDGKGKKVAITILVDHTDRFIRREIERACEIVLNSKVKWNDEAKVSHVVSRAVERIAESLTIKEKEYKTFLEARQKYSETVTSKEVKP